MDISKIIVGSADCPIAPIAGILCQDEVISKDWPTLSRGLGVSSVKIGELRRDLFLTKISLSDLIWDVLETWIACTGDKSQLVSLLLVVEIDCDAADAGGSLRHMMTLPCTNPYAYPSVRWDDLTQPRQIQVDCHLKKLYPFLNTIAILPTLQGQILIELLRGRRPQICKQTLPAKLSYYVNRTILIRNKISTQIFAANPSHTFLLTGIGRAQLSKFAGDKCSTDHSTNQIKKHGPTVKHMILDNQNHFDKICELTPAPVHLFDYEDNELTWVKSRGCFERVQEFVDTSQDHLKEDDFCSTLASGSNQPICISDSPGMGKTTLLVQIGHTLSEMYPERHVIFLVFSEFIREIRRTSYMSAELNVKHALKSMICSNVIGNDVLLHCLNSEDKNVAFELLLDGFDEVNQSDIGLAHETLKTISKLFTSVRIWVTTRPHFINELEITLGVLGYSIQPFSESDQIRFMINRWSGNKNRLSLFARYCLNKLKANLKSSGRSGHIAGIPLQCLLISEVYQDDAEGYAASANYCLPLSRIVIDSFMDLYKSIVNRKFQRSTVDAKTLMEMHIRLSMKLVFPEHFQKLFYLFPQIDEEEILKVGILEGFGPVNPRMFRFIHRTFAEYFIAIFAVEGLKMEHWTPDITSFYYDGVFGCRDVQVYLYRGRFGVCYTGCNPCLCCVQRNRSFSVSEEKFPSHQFNQTTITYFINGLIGDLKDFSELFHQHLLNLFISSDRLKQLSHASANGNFVHVFKLFKGFGMFDKHKQVVFNHPFLLLSIKKTDSEFVKLVLADFEHYHGFNSKTKMLVLAHAIERSDFATVEYLIKEREFDQVIKLVHPKMIAYRCLSWFTDTHERNPTDKMEVIKLLLEITDIFKNNFSEGLEFPPFRLGAPDTIFHFDKANAKCNSAREDYHKLITSIPIEKFRKVVDVCANYNDTPLMRLVRHIDPMVETLDIFHEAGANFNRSRLYADTVLAIAIRHLRNAATIQKLIQCGANVHKNVTVSEKLWGWTTYLHIAAQVGNSQAVAVLLKWIDENKYDSERRTARECAIEKRREDAFERGLSLAKEWDVNKRE